MGHITVNEGIDTLTNWHTSSSGDKRGSTDNHYKDWLNDIRVGFYEEADYGVDWVGTGSGVDVETTFPGTPSDGVLFVRVNTNAESGNLREYRYNGHTDAWEFNEFRGAISVTTTFSGITSMGPQTAIDYGNTAARAQHSIQIIGNDNTGTFTNATVVLESSLDGVNFDSDGILTITITGAGNEIDFITFGSVHIRPNVTVLNVSGDADLDIVITSL